VDGPERVRAYVQAETPGGAVPLSGKEVSPVLRDEPETGRDRHSRGEVVVDAVEEPPDGKAEQQGHAEMPLVHACTQDVDPRAQPMTIDSKHALPFDTIVLADEADVNAAIVTRRLSWAIR
jgi:hypothetical protein